MPNLLKYLSPAILLASAFWVSEASASTVPYHADRHAANGLVNFTQRPEKSFDLIPHSTEEHQAGLSHELQDMEHDHEDEHANDHNSYDNQYDRNDDLENNIPAPSSSLVPSSYPLVVSSPSAVPVPGALWLFLSGIIGLGVVGKSRRR